MAFPMAGPERGIFFHLRRPWDLNEFGNGNLTPETIAAKATLTAVFDLIGPYLTPDDMHKTRRVSRLWRYLMTQHRMYKGEIEGTIHTKWYAHVKQVEAAGGAPDWRWSPHWKTLKLEHFKFYRHSTAIKDFWVETNQLLTTLKLEKCSLECDGFRFLLEYTPSLKTLEIKDVRLTDYADLHKDEREPQRLRDGPPPELRSQLTYLSFEGISSADGCFMDIIIQRTGQLETLSVVDCFQTDPAVEYRAKTRGMPSWAQVQMDFLDDVSHLIRVNSNTLRSLDILSGVSQDNVWVRLAELDVMPPHLGISFHASTMAQLEAIQTLLNKTELQSLHLEIGNQVPVDSIVNALCLAKPTLQKLKVSFTGKESFAGAEGTGTLNLSRVFKHFTQLEKFWVMDRKALTKLDRRVLDRRHKLFPYRIHRGLGFDAAKLKSILVNTNSHIDISPLGDLPATISDLRLDGIINHQDVFSDERLLTQLTGLLGNLTRLEIRGPWLTPLTGILKSLYANSPGLQALIVPACAVTDEDITGLCREAVFGIRKGMGYAFDLYSAPDFANRGGFEELVEEASANWNAQRNMRRVAYPVPGRPKLSDLRDLVHLDLGYNPRISDVGIYSAMKIPNLRTLGLHSCHRVTDSGLSLLSMNCPNLEALNIKNVRSVSAVGISELIRNCRNLKRVYTTKVIIGRTFEGFQIQMSQNFNDIVRSSILTPMEDILGTHDENGVPFDDDEDEEPEEVPNDNEAEDMEEDSDEGEPEDGEAANDEAEDTAEDSDSDEGEPEDGEAANDEAEDTAEDSDSDEGEPEDGEAPAPEDIEAP